MPAYEIRERLIPYRILAYLLYARPIASEWLESADTNAVRVTTGSASRELRMRNAQLWEALFWLEEQGLVKSVRKEKKRGTALVTLIQPTNIQSKIEKVLTNE